MGQVNDRHEFKRYESFGEKIAQGGGSKKESA